MISMVDALTLWVVMMALAATPSTSVALVLTRSAASGVAAGAAVAVGIVLGDLLFVCLALLGMSALAESLSGAFYWVRLACGSYLIYLGWRCWRAAPQSANPRVTATPGGLWRDTLTGLLITLADVKAIVFYASLFPAFVDLSRMTLQGLSVVMVITIVAVGGTKLAYAYGAHRIAQATLTQRFASPAQRIGGTLLGAIGLYLVIGA
ncbi:LysE family translocator [Marinimicrobium sp. C6131]|uniref:LysE family translocator n=1 Tax=Marinimicrobium sp. C6131 TaxID=3022676 RepID=UPI00223CBE59|nr:LysE family translocator [Marinimicrobium sp. C6131]UZJ43214.1 LysE family translocator [Marinimicrobium sp. C6131]